MNRQAWSAMLAKLVAPMDAERAAKAIAGMLPMLSHFPDAAFSVASLEAVCASGRVLPDGSQAPMNRVPTLGELALAIGRNWAKEREMMRLRQMPIVYEGLPAPKPEDRDPVVIEAVRNVVGAFVEQRTWNRPENQLPGDRHKVRPRHLTDQQLLIEYEALSARGIPGAAIRVAMLRKKLGLVMSEAPALVH
jgi:hypothetical protein